MLKRQQVILNDWLIEWTKYISEKYDLSFSEIIRLALSIYYCQIINEAYPKSTYGIDNATVIKTTLSSIDGRVKREELHKLISKIYFEGRKAVDHGLAQQGKELKKKYK